MNFPKKNACYITQSLYICTVFFMVLDLRLTMKIGCPRWIAFFAFIRILSKSIFPVKLILQVEGTTMCEEAPF